MLRELKITMVVCGVTLGIDVGAFMTRPSAESPRLAADSGRPLVPPATVRDPSHGMSNTRPTA
jgi:hypothetical protein